MTCQKCKYWIQNQEQYNINYGICLNKKLINNSDIDIDYSKDDCLIVSTYHMDDSDLETGKNFKCIHYKNKIKDMMEK